MTPERGRDPHSDRHHDHDDDTARYERLAPPTAPGPPTAPDTLNEPDTLNAPDVPDEPGQRDLSSKEEALRRLLHDTVHDLQPSPDSLAYLSRAVRARRTHRRQALVGAAAALLLAGTAVPALIHTANTAKTASGSQIENLEENGGQGEPGGADTSGLDPAGPGGLPATSGAHSGGKDGKGTDKSGGPSGPSSPSPGERGGGASDTMAATSPSCDRDQLGQATGEVGEPDGSGKVYGSFRVVNVSPQTCTVSGGGRIDKAAQGSADDARIQVVDHTEGDPADGLPVVAGDPVILRPGEAYLVKFGWVPESGSNGCTTSSQPTSDGGSSTGSGSETGSEPASGDPGQTPAGSVVLSHVPEAGDPAAASTEITDVCAGTVYRTPAMAEA